LSFILIINVCLSLKTRALGIPPFNKTQVHENNEKRNPKELIISDNLFDQKQLSNHHDSSNSTIELTPLQMITVQVSGSSASSLCYADRLRLTLVGFQGRAGIWRGVMTRGDNLSSGSTLVETVINTLESKKVEEALSKGERKKESDLPSDSILNGRGMKENISLYKFLLKYSLSTEKNQNPKRVFEEQQLKKKKRRREKRFLIHMNEFKYLEVVESPSDRQRRNGKMEAYQTYLKSF